MKLNKSFSRLGALLLMAVCAGAVSLQAEGNNLLPQPAKVSPDVGGWPTSIVRARSKTSRGIAHHDCALHSQAGGGGAAREVKITNGIE